MILGNRLVMGTRSGDMDPAVLLYLMDKCGMSTREADTMLNKKSGFLGLCGKADVRAVLEEADAGNERAKLAIEVRTVSGLLSGLITFQFENA